MSEFRPVDVDAWVKGFEDPWMREMMRAYAEGYNRLWFGPDWRRWRPSWWRRLLAFAR